MFIVAEKGERDALLLRPCFLREWIVARNAKHLGIERVVLGNPFGNLAELRGAATGEGHRHEEQHDIGFSDEVAQGDQLRAGSGFSDECEIWGFVADFDGHGSMVVG